MAIFDIYSKRQNQLRGEASDIFVYDVLSDQLKVQIIHILDDCIGHFEYNEDIPYKIYLKIRDILCREYGKFELARSKGLYCYTPYEELKDFFLSTTNYEQALDVVELAFKAIDKVVRSENYKFKTDYRSKIDADEAIQALNTRFKENSVGYQYESGYLIRLDSTYMHSEVTKSVLNLLGKSDIFIGANEEYLLAHEHYKDGKNKECLNECLKAFESTMRIIGKEKDWGVSDQATSKALIKACFDNNLIPTFTQNQFTSLRSLLESGIPTIRNNLSGHGQGSTPKKVTDEMTRYALNLTGANIIFLIEQSGL